MPVFLCYLGTGPSKRLQGFRIQKPSTAQHHGIPVFGKAL